MVTTVTTMTIVMIVIDAKKAINSPTMLETGIEILTGRKRSAPNAKRFLNRRNVEVVVFVRRTKTTLRVSEKNKVLARLVVMKVV